MESHSVIALRLQTDNLSVEIVPPDPKTTTRYEEETISTFRVTYGVAPGPPAPLVYCPEPEPGLAHIQAREQTGYDVWLTWQGQDIPQVFLGDGTAPLAFKHSGTSGYVSLNWGNYVGASEVRIHHRGREMARLPVEVRSRKMGYLDDYRCMLDDISERLTSLIFDYGSPTAVYAQRAAPDAHVAYLDYLFLRYLMEERRLPHHFRLVAADPHRVARREDVWVDLSRARTLTPRALQAMLAYGEHLARPRRVVAPALASQLKGYVPRELLDERVITTFDTPPNRFVKHFMARLVLKLRELERLFGDDSRAAHLARDCRHWRRSLENVSRAHFLEDVGEMHVYPAGSQVLLKQEGYRQLNDYYRRFLLTGKVTWEGFEELLKTPNKDLATLYEYWCFFQLLDAVAVALDTPVEARQFIKEEGGVFKVDIQGGSSGAVGQATVYYNRSFGHGPGGSYSVTLRPDYTVELPDGRRFVFDAKYKYDRPGEFMSRELNAEEERDEEERLTYKRGDLYKMHTYRDALSAQAVFVLYPGNEFQAFSQDGDKPSQRADLTPDFEGVGAIDLGVGDNAALVDVMVRLLRES